MAHLQGNGALPEGGTDTYMLPTMANRDNEDFRRNGSTIFRALQFYEPAARWPVDVRDVVAVRFPLLPAPTPSPAISAAI